MCGYCCGGTPIEKRGSGHSGCSEDCYNAPKRRSRKVAAPPVTVTDEMVERATRALDTIVPNSDGVLWNYEHEDGQKQPVTLKDAARAALTAALTEEA